MNGLEADPSRASRWRRFDDRLNPVLVKETRQAMRGRYFRISYLITLSLAILIALLMIVVSSMDSTPDALGPSFFTAMFACLAGAVFFWVPFSAFVSMGAEWEENTFDLLVLSNLRPRQVVFGKLWSSGLQALLYFSAFGPFLVFAFLLNGLDLWQVGLILPAAMILSLCLTLVAIGISSLSRVRFVRVTLMTLTAALLLTVTLMSIGFVATSVQSSFVSPSELRLFLAVLLSVAIVVGLQMSEVAVVRLSHAEEDRSTGPRALTLGTLLVGLGWAHFALADSFDSDGPWITMVTALFLLMLPAMFFATEPESLGRRVSMKVPRNRTLALLATPFLPGGGRGMLFSLLLIVLVFAQSPLFFLHARGRSGNWFPLSLAATAAMAMYAVVFVGLPAFLGRRRSHISRQRTRTRVFIPLLGVACLLIPTFVRFLGGNFDKSASHHAGNLFWLVNGFSNDGIVFFFGSVLLLVVAALTLLLNLPRIVHGIAEIQEASAWRRRGLTGLKPSSSVREATHSLADVTQVVASVERAALTATPVAQEEADAGSAS